MPDFRKRSDKKEYIDSPVPKKAFHRNLQELDVFNRLSGGHAVSLNGVKALLGSKDRIYQIVDIGCGSGDFMKYMALWGRKKGYKFRMTGVDYNEDAIEYLRINCTEFPEISGLTMDYRKFLAEIPETDIIHSALFGHHLSDTDLVAFFKLSMQKSRLGFVMNDLYRNPLSYFAAKYLTRFAKGSYLARHDGPLSVLRGFKESELQQLLKHAQIENFSVCRKWIYRFLTVTYADNRN